MPETPPRSSESAPPQQGASPRKEASELAPLGSAEFPLGSGAIRLVGVRVNNLQEVSLNLPLGQLIAICGKSGSGKTSLAIHTLHAEGQRRFLETLSAQDRQWLARLEKPDAEMIDGVPPTIALQGDRLQPRPGQSIGTATELDDHLGSLYAALGSAVCEHCLSPIPEPYSRWLPRAVSALPAGTRLLVVAPIAWADTPLESLIERLQQSGWLRAIWRQQMFALDDPNARARLQTAQKSDIAASIPIDEFSVVVDRLTKESNSQRILDSLRTALMLGSGQARLWADQPWPDEWSSQATQANLDTAEWHVLALSNGKSCPKCQQAWLPLEPGEFNFTHALGACPACAGTGKQQAKEGGAASSAAVLCPVCNGARLRPRALHTRLLNQTWSQLQTLSLDQVSNWLTSPTLTQAVGDALLPVLEQAQSRCNCLCRVGLGELALSRELTTLSSGETCRVQLAQLLASSLVGVLYVLDEPLVGLHTSDAQRVLELLLQLKAQGNTLLLVEHWEPLLAAADHLIELGPGAGPDGGKVVWQGPPAQAAERSQSLLAEYLSGRAGRSLAEEKSTRHWLQLRGAAGRNLQGIDVAFPLGLLCAVTGVSGAGKSSLVRATLYPALAAALGAPAGETLPFASLAGAEQLDSVVYLAGQPFAASPRANVATYIKAFDEIRTAFAAAPEAKLRNFTAAHFSFNAGPGRCQACQGTGQQAVEMQFLPDIHLPCPECQGNRYRPDVLQVRIRDQNLAEVLRMTVREAFGFFRGRFKVQAPLQQLLDVGLEYLQLGQPLHTLSSGEVQRLKLAQRLAQQNSSRTLILLEEPARGLHFSDVTKLLDSMATLLKVGHSLIVVEHRLQVLAQADYLIDLGPGSGSAGGRVQFAGSPREMLKAGSGPTADALRNWFHEDRPPETPSRLAHTQQG